MLQLRRSDIEVGDPAVEELHVGEGGAPQVDVVQPSPWNVTRSRAAPLATRAPKRLPRTVTSRSVESA